MHYKDLLTAAKLFKKDPTGYDHSYRHARNCVDWNNLNKLSRKEIINKVIRFLNQWACRLDSANFGKIADGIIEASEAVNPFLSAVENETIEDIDFFKVKEVGNKEFDNFEIIHEVFSEFCNIGYKFRWVAASKTLHQVLPRLFVMWDNPICGSLGLDLTPRSYVHSFLPMMQREVNEALRTCMEDHNCGRDAAIRYIVYESRIISGYEKTLAKLVDEFNWIKYTKGCL